MTETKHGPHNVGRKVTWTLAGTDPVEFEITEWSKGCSDGTEPHKYGFYGVRTAEGRNSFIRYSDFRPDGDGHVFATWVPDETDERPAMSPDNQDLAVMLNDVADLIAQGSLSGEDSVRLLRFLAANLPLLLVEGEQSGISRIAAFVRTLPSATLPPTTEENP